MKKKIKRSYPIGAELFDSGTHFRVWAPDHKKVELVIENIEGSPLYYVMHKEKNGYFSYFSSDVKEGTLYRFRLSNSAVCPDPASRYQPHGTLGPSCVVSSKYPWKDEKWPGVEPYGHIAYEMHIGTYTKQGTFNAAKGELDYLKKLGITLIEVMPINDFPGRYGWGYDGVNLFAPTHLYGKPKDVKEFVDTAHNLGIGVVLDVVYNHLGPEDNEMIKFSKDYLSQKYSTDWGVAVNFDNPSSKEFFLTNALYWIQEFHFDGLRIDATPWFFSSTTPHILAELTKVIKKAGGKRKTIAIGENEPQDTKLLRPYDEGGYGFDILWNDDFHHAANVRLTGKREAYYTDYLGSPQEFISSLKYGFLYQGQYYQWQQKNRGTPWTKIPPHAMMIFLENHDQIANTGFGMRLHQRADLGNYKAMSFLLLLSPNTPLIFQGQEFNANQPFYYFSDHNTYLSSLIKAGRKKELAQFPRLATPEIRKSLPDPANPLTFIECKIDLNDRVKNKEIFYLYRDLIHLRKTDPVFSKMHTLHIDGAVLGNDSFLIRYFGGEEGDRLLIINFGPDYHLNPAPEPLLAPPLDHEFKLMCSSESLLYGGEGTPPLNVQGWKLLGHSAVVLQSKPLLKQ